MKNKPEIRKEILRKTGSQEPGARRKKDRIIEKRLLALPEYKKAKTAAFYHSYGSEVNTHTLIEKALASGKRVVIPAITGDDLEFREIKGCEGELAKGLCGIMEPGDGSAGPFPKDRIDLIVVPGVAFTREGARLGRGKGFYDRFLKALPAGVKKIALAYDCQIVDSIPTAPHDVPVDIVLSN